VARFRSVGAMVIGSVKHRPGQVFADAEGSLQPGDVLWLGLDKWTVGPNLIPLDAGARSIIAASRFAGEPPWPASGASSIG
jgi:hypothetical protein